MKHYDIPCQHETDGVPVDQQVTDYHALSEQEVLYLLQIARRQFDAGDWQTSNSIQIRLGQGVIGLVCPHEIEGKVSENGSQINFLFVDYMKHPETYEDVSLLAKELHRLMQA